MEKRILCIVGLMDAGGAETFLMKIYRQMDKTKYQMDFAVAVERKGFYDKEILSMGGKIYHLIPKSEGFLKNFKSIQRIVKENGYKYVLRTSQHSLSAIELLAAYFGGAKARVFRSSNSNTTTGTKKQIMLHNLCMFMPRHFANVRIAPSTEAAEFMFGKGCIAKGKAVLLHNAIDMNVYHFDPVGRKQIREEFGLLDKFVVGHVGRFNQQKNHTFLLDVFRKLMKEKPNARLVLVGKGELEEQIRKKVRDLRMEPYVIFVGVRQDVSQLLSAFDVFLFPSLYEGMPNTVIEAQATGLPCVIADTITKEADITGLVKYLPLDISANEWAEQAIAASSTTHKDTSKEFAAAGYDIESTTKMFIKLVFGE